MQTVTEGVTTEIPLNAIDRLGKRLGRYSAGLAGTPELLEWLRDHEEELSQVGTISTGTRGERLGSCGAFLEFMYFYTHPERRVQLSRGLFCQQHLLCGLCAIRRAAKLLRRYLPKILTAIGPGMFVYLGTHTQPVGVDLSERWESIDGYLRKFWERAKNGRDRRRRGKVREISLINAGVFSVEVKRSEGTHGAGGWHVHAHSVLISDRELDCEAVKRDWVECTAGAADAGAQDVQVVRSMALLSSEDLSELQVVEGLGGDLLEVFKYPLKFASLPPADRWEAATVLHGRRLIRGTGRLRGLRADEKYLEEPLQAADWPYVTLIFRHEAGQYVRERTVFA